MDFQPSIYKGLTCTFRESCYSALPTIIEIYLYNDDLSSQGRKEGNVYLTTHSTHFIYGYMASDI